MLGDVVRQAAGRYADIPVYVCPDGAVLSYADLDAASEEVAAALRSRGVGEGDVVALLLPSGPHYAVAYAASAKIGAITAGVNDRLTPTERRRCLAVAHPRLVVASTTLARATEPGLAHGVDEVVEVDADDRAPRAVLRELRTRRAVDRGSALTIRADIDRPVAVVFTSGTTGEPKGAVFAGRQLEAISDIDGGRKWGAGGRGLSSTSFAHLGYMTKLPQGLRGGGTTFLMDKWSAGEALDMVARHRVTTLGGIPTQLALMLRHERFPSTDTSSVRAIAIGGGPASASLVREARAAFGVPVVVRYTCTEAGVGVGTAPDDPPEDAELTVGRARPGVELTVRDDDDRPVPDGEIGQVCLRSTAAMVGYWRDPGATAEAFTADGAVRTGDLGYIDTCGRLHLEGRIKEMYVRGGYNVFPLEVENVLADHPDVAHVAVIPRADAVMGEIGVAVVVPRRGAPAPTLETLRTHARERLATYKLPEAILVTDELPRTAMEKIDRRALASLVTSAPATSARRR